MNPAEQHVLVIDDDELSREVLTVLLTGEGYPVNPFSSGEDALAHAVQPAIILMDWQMPGISGEALAQQLRTAFGSFVTLIAMSGSMQQRTPDSVCNAFLLKPFSMQAFAETLSASEQNPTPAQPSVPSQASASDREVLHPETFHGFQAMMNTDSLRELYTLTLLDAEKQLATIQAAWKGADDAEVRRCAHAIKGSLGMVGALELQRLCATLDAQGIADANVATLSEFPAATDRLRRMLRARGIKL